MTDHEQLDDPAEVLLDACRSVVGAWLIRCVVETAVSITGSCESEVRDRARTMAERAAPAVVARLEDVLRTDVDDQRTGPLAVLRSAVVHPTGVLEAAGVPPVRRDEFEERMFPHDRYRLAPASFADVDPSLQDPGIVWGAWKAATVLQRRRSEGLR